jgi:hypothetical protein
MTIEELVRLTDARGRHPKWRAKCPVHKSRSLTLAIYDDGDTIGLHCHGGCKKDDVLASWGLTWKDLKPSKAFLPPEQYREAMRKASMRKELDNLRRQYGLMIFMEALDSSKSPKYWQAAQKRVLADIGSLRCQLEPEKVITECYQAMMQKWADSNPVEAEKHAMERIAAASIAGLT